MLCRLNILSQVCQTFDFEIKSDCAEIKPPPTQKWGHSFCFICLQSWESCETVFSKTMLSKNNSFTGEQSKCIHCV